MSWLEGFWINQDSTAVEQWSSEGTMLAGWVHKVNDLDNFFEPGEKLEILEKLELKVDAGKLLYSALTKEHNWEPLEFIQASSAKNEMAFYNATNDFPKWIIYKQTKPGTLQVTIKNDETTRTFLYQKLSPPSEKINE